MSAVHQRSKLTGSQQAAQAVLRHRHEEKLQVLRSMVEADPGCGLINHLGKVENRLHANDLAGAGDAMIDIERALKERGEQVSATASISQTVRLATNRDEVIDDKVAGSSNVRILNRDGLLWLKAKKRLPAAELAALERYRTLFDKVHSGPTADSTNAVERGPPKGSSMSGEADLSRVEAIWTLDQAREAVAHDDALLWLLNEVAGKGATLRDLAKGDDREAARLETELRVAARMLAKRFGLRG